MTEHIILGLVALALVITNAYTIKRLFELREQPVHVHLHGPDEEDVQAIDLPAVSVN